MLSKYFDFIIMSAQSLTKSQTFSLKAVPHCINSGMFTEALIVSTAHTAFIALEILDSHSLTSEYVGRRAPDRQAENNFS